MKKEHLKGFFAGLLASVLLMGALNAGAEPVYRQLNALYSGIKICLNGNYIEPKDATGATVEPFAVDGTTYLPVRAVAGALGLPVDWDGNTQTVYLGEKPSNGSAADGSRSNPYPADAGATVSYNEYSSKPTRQIQVKCTKIFRGDVATLICYQPSKAISSSQELIVLEMDVKYLSSTDGEDDVLKGSDIIYTDTFFTADGGSIMTDLLTVSSSSGKNGVFDAEVYPGGSCKVYFPSIIEKSTTDILLKIPSEARKKNAWIKCNSADNVITDIQQAKAYLGLLDEDNKASSPVKISLRTSLPTTLSEYDYSQNRVASASITEFDYSVSGTTVTLTFTGEKTYDKEGSGQSRAVKVGWKLYDSEGYVVKDGTARSTSVKTGEKFKNCESSIYNVEPGTYELEIMGVN